MDAHLERGQSVPAGVGDESVPPRHLAAVGPIETELDHDRC